MTVRFPAYRLVKSRCWGTNGDARLTCFACHDPHQPLQRDAAAYDVACLRCHANGGAASENSRAHQAACPVAKSQCTSCHMPKVNIAEMHYDFTDHNIRIVKANAPFPD
jgi:formate-dependent nitrite reductase cytochrome c552 subunit